MENDLISRNTLVAAIQEYQMNLFHDKFRLGEIDLNSASVLANVERIVCEAPSVEAEPKWISVEERLPEAEGNYLVCSEFADIRSLKIMTFSLNLESVDEYCFAGEKRPGWWDFDGETGNYEWSHVTH